MWREEEGLENPSADTPVWGGRGAGQAGWEDAAVWWENTQEGQSLKSERRALGGSVSG